ncbi:hypothetical protein EDB19DRAFT_1970525 [Suillus lakei]|nr:hypothetical protein EDB19DRAFT_1970525 [Suillus lakei]
MSHGSLKVRRTETNHDALACRIAELGTKALDGARHGVAADHFTATVNSCALSSTSAINPIYNDFVVLSRKIAASSDLTADMLPLLQAIMTALLAYTRRSLNSTLHFMLDTSRSIHGAHRYDEAKAAFRTMLAKLESAPDAETQNLRKQYLSPSELEDVIRKAIIHELYTAPLQTVATCFHCVMLSHRWEEGGPLLQDIQDKIMYELDSPGGIVKLRTCCEIARDAGYRWAWSDTRCINKNNNVWYRHSALTVVCLFDVPPSSKSGALAKRMGGAREKLQWASNRVTTHREDVAYSLFGVFGVRLPVNYGKKEHVLGRLLQKIVARSGDITALDWTEVASLRKNTVAVDSASTLYALLENMSAPRFMNCRLHLPCISFRVTEVKLKRGPAQETHFTYGVKADGLQDLLITTDETLIQFSQARPARQMFFLVHPWAPRAT